MASSYIRRDLVGRFLHDVYVVARLVDLVERFEVCEHVLLDVRTEHVAKKCREIFQRERVTRYRKMKLPVNDTHVTVNRGYNSEFQNAMFLVFLTKRPQKSEF